MKRHRFFISLFLLLAVTIGASAQGYKSGTLNMTPRFSRFAKDYVEDHINEWQKKGEFEKTEEYRNRIETQRDAKIEEFTQLAMDQYIMDQKPANLKSELELGSYNADAEMYIISHPDYGDFALPIPVKEAPEFRDYWLQLQPEPYYIIEGDVLALESITFGQLKKKTKRAYTANRVNAADYAATEINFDFEPVEIPVAQVASNPTTAPARPEKKSTPSAAKSDIDLNIPSASKTSNANTFAVVIANENYRRVSNVDYAHNDGDAVANYFTETLGIPSNQVLLVKDATLNDMKGELEWMREVGEAYGGDASFILYYAGHGIPDESTRDGYLLPVDGYGNMVSTGLAMSELNDKIAAVPSKLSLIILDACFSGTMRDGDMLASARGVAIKVRPGAVNKGKVVVLTASQNDEIASKSDDYGHGIFTYYLLKKIHDSKGQVKLGELADYAIDQVKRYSIVQNRKTQTPSVLASPMVKDSWSEITLTDFSKIP